MLKKVLGSLVVLGLVIGGGSVLQVMGGSPQGVAKEETKEVKNKGTERENKRLKPKIQRQVGTPTVQQLLDKVKDNYSKIQDLKADMVDTIEKPGGWGYPILKDRLTQEGTYYFKAPDKLKFKHPIEEKQTIIFKQQTQHLKDYEKNKVISYRISWYRILDPIHLPFYWRLDEIITKFDTKVISNPQPDIWVIEAVPKASNPEDDYNYPNPNGKLEVFVDYDKGVITKIDDFSDFTEFHSDVPPGLRLTCRRESQNFTLISNTWIPTKFITTKFTIPKFRPKEVKEEIALSNIKINIGISDSEFEF